MSVFQRFSIKKINKIRKILLLYIDKDLKLHFKNKNHENTLSKRLIDNNIIYEKSYSQPIQIEQNYFSNNSQVENEFNLIRYNSVHFTVSENDFIPNINKIKNGGLSYRANSLNIKNKQEILNLKLISKKEVSKDMSYRLSKMSNAVRNINKYDKKYIIIKDDKLRLRKKDSLNYLTSLYRNFKCLTKRKRCLSTKKINEEKKIDEKETILEVKEKQKGNNKDNKKDRKVSVLISKKNVTNMNSEDTNDMVLLTKKQKRRRSLFAKDK